VWDINIIAFVCEEGGVGFGRDRASEMKIDTV
jgi:hypothetical protein